MNFVKKELLGVGITLWFPKWNIDFFFYKTWNNSKENSILILYWYFVFKMIVYGEFNLLKVQYLVFRYIKIKIIKKNTNRIKKASHIEQKIARHPRRA